MVHNVKILFALHQRFYQRINPWGENNRGFEIIIVTNSSSEGPRTSNLSYFKDDDRESWITSCTSCNKWNNVFDNALQSFKDKD